MLGLKVANTSEICRGSVQVLHVQSSMFEHLWLCHKSRYQIKGLNQHTLFSVIEMSFVVEYYHRINVPCFANKWLSCAVAFNSSRRPLSTNNALLHWHYLLSNSITEISCLGVFPSAQKTKCECKICVISCSLFQWIFCIFPSLT